MKRICGKVKHQLALVLPLVALGLGVLAMVFGGMSVSQAAMPTMMQQQFLGEYSYDYRHWQPLSADTELDALEGDLYLRGGFAMSLPEESRMNYYTNHIAAEIYIDGHLYSQDIQLELENYGIPLQPSMCSRGWQSWYFPQGLAEDAQVEIHLSNPHRLGNRWAFRDFLDTLCVHHDGIDLLSHSLKGYSRPFTAVATVLIIASLLVLGAAVTAGITRIPTGGKLVKLGLLTAFAGVYFLLDTIDLSLWSGQNIINTYGRQISMMLSVHLMGVLNRDALTGQQKRIASVATTFSTLLCTGILLASCFGGVLIYDTLLWWVCCQPAVCGLLILATVLELHQAQKKDRPELVICLLLFGSLLVDGTGITRSIYSEGNLTKTVFLVYAVFTFFRAMGGIIADHKASVRAKALEKELEESRIALMLSQIQPHFIFNVLGTIRGLCREDPEQAWGALGDFAAYLRGNMNALSNSTSIPFEEELHHVETYLQLEKMRLGERLSIVYDIQAKDFSLPPLTLQPLVENAVKHGIFFRKEGGTVIIQSLREGQQIRLTVQDNGVGFDTGNTARDPWQHAPVGIANVRNRVEKMLEGVLQIQSSPNCGTTVTIAFPEKEKEGGATAQHDHTGSR